MERLRTFLLVVCFFICPLLFFTNLTRNPHYTQICLLNICLVLAFAVHMARDVSAHGEIRLARTPLDVPLAAVVEKSRAKRAQTSPAFGRIRDGGDKTCRYEMGSSSRMHFRNGNGCE